MTASRRDFVTGLTAVGAVWLTGALACRDNADQAMETHLPPDSAAPPRELQFLTPDEFTELEAITARIIPTDETPGAKEAGVAWFIDGGLVTFGTQDQPMVRSELVKLARDVARAHRGKRRFSELTPEQQDAMLKSMEETPFFGFIRFATIAGLLALPKYGGNKDYIGWELVGQERGYEFMPPFGWYDRPENQRALLGRVL
jgi:gluconate 2-dehydrogenase gamma chain